MSRKNITIDNISPLIEYRPVGAWSEGNSSDSALNSYSASTYTQSVDRGATATLSFNGTGIWLFGAKRADHGLYNVTLDGETTTANGSMAGPGAFQTLLFSAENLQNTLHTVTLTNAGTNPDRQLDFLDLDYITWESTLGTGSEKVRETIFQDSDPSFSYQPPIAWNTNVSNASQYLGRSGHVTASTGAFVTFGFTGDAVGIYGATGLNNGPYTVQLDGGPTSTYNVTKSTNATQVLIYYADNLGPGPHNVKIVNQPILTGEVLNIDFAKVDVLSPSSSALSGGAIAGIVVGIVAIIGLGIGLFFVLRRRNVKTFEKKDFFARPYFPNLARLLPSMSSRTSSSSSFANNPLSPNTQSYRDSLATPYGHSGYNGMSHEPTTLSINQPIHTSIIQIPSAGPAYTPNRRPPPSEWFESPTSDEPFAGQRRLKSNLTTMAQRILGARKYWPSKGTSAQLPSSPSLARGRFAG